MKKVFYFLVFAVFISVNANSQNSSKRKYSKNEFAKVFCESFCMDEDKNQNKDSPDNKAVLYWNMQMNQLSNLIYAATYGEVNVGQVAKFHLDIVDVIDEYFFPYWTQKRKAEYEAKLLGIQQIITSLYKGLPKQ